MKIRENNNGFTLIELLAVIVVLGLIATIGVISVSEVINSSKNSVYEQQVANIIKAAEEWAVEHTEELPNNIGEIKSVYLSELVSAGKLSSVPYNPISSTEMYGYVRIRCKNSNCNSYVYEYIGY